MIRVAAGILFRKGRILICRRKSGGPHALKWEFPGGKIKEGETAGAALCRELMEELLIIVRPAGLRSLDTVRHHYPQGPDVEIQFFQVGEFTGEPENLSFEEIAWVAIPDLSRHDFLEADRPVVAGIAAGEVLCHDKTMPPRA